MENPLKWTEKQKGIFNQMGAIVEAMNGISMKDLEQMQHEISRDEAIGSLLNPAVWRDGKFEEASMIKKVVKAIIAFKKEVSGIGRLHKVETHAKKD